MEPNNDRESKPTGGQTRQPWMAPTTDPTNPHNQEAAGVWVPNAQASERRNSEPGMTDGERQRRKS